MKQLNKREEFLLGIIDNIIGGKIGVIEARLEVLECDHEYAPVEWMRTHIYSGDGGTVSSQRKAYSVKCAKCGNVLCDITEREYLLETLESHTEQCNEECDRLKIRLDLLDFQRGVIDGAE